jgi:Helix-turn-helix domain
VIPSNFGQLPSGEGSGGDPFALSMETQHVTRRKNVLAQRRRAIKRAFGQTLRAIREATPPLTGTYKRADCPFMTQSQLAEELSRVIEEETGECHYVETDWVNKVECGQIWIEPDLVRMMARALRADEANTALLLEMHGYNGVAQLALERQGQVVVVASCFVVPSSDGSRSERRTKRQAGLAQARDLISLVLDATQAEHARKHGAPDS